MVGRASVLAEAGIVVLREIRGGTGSVTTFLESEVELNEFLVLALAIIGGGAVLIGLT